MKYFDKVKVINDRKEYNENNIYKGMIGTIFEAEIRDNSFYCIFESGDDYDWYFECPIYINDLEFVEDGNCTDEWILDAIPNNNKDWWCKVENGYITNLKGERKNKIPYDYNS